MTNHAFPKLNRRKSSVRRICTGAAVSAVFAASLTLSFTSLAATVYNVGVAGEPTMTEIHTFIKDPVRIANNAGVYVGRNDVIALTPLFGGENVDPIVCKLDGKADPAALNTGDNSNLIVYRSGKAAVQVDGEQHLVDTGESIAQTIADSGITLGNGDTLNVSLDELAYDGMEIQIDRAFDVFVEDGDTVYTYRSTGCKAGEAVYALGLTLGEEDEMDIPPETEMHEGETVRVLRCVYSERTEQEKIDYDTTYVQDDRLFEGQSRVISKGVYGSQDVVYRDKYLGDSCVASEALSRTVTKEPVSAVKAVGTRVFSVAGKTPISSLPLPDGFELDENGVPASYKSYFDGVATAYYGDAYTASGLPAGVGYVAVDPKVIPYGTKLWVASLDGRYVYGYAIAADTGGFVKGGWADMDLYMATEDECWEFGIRGVRIYIL